MLLEPTVCGFVPVLSYGAWYLVYASARFFFSFLSASVEIESLDVDCRYSRNTLRRVYSRHQQHWRTKMVHGSVPLYRVNA